MGRHIHLEAYLSTDELEQRYRAAHEPHERSWWQILWLLARGETATAIAASTGYSAYWIGQLAKRYNVEGPAGMVNRQHTHSRRTALLLTPEQLAELRQALAGAPPPGEGELWTGRAVAAWMAQRVGRPVRPTLGWVYLVRLGGKRRVPRPRHVLADPAAHEAFKKNSAD